MNVMSLCSLLLFMYSQGLPNVIACENMVPRKDLEQRSPLVRISFLTDQEVTGQNANPPITVQLNTKGQFISISGGLIPREQLRTFYELNPKDADHTPILVVNIRDEENTPLPVLLAAINDLMQAAPPGARLHVFVRTRKLSGKM